jgi:hypothetical protein
MTRRDPSTHRAPVLPIRPLGAGRSPVSRPTIVSVTEIGSRRISTVRRADGSAFTVTVPAGGIDARPDPTHSGAPWIREHGGCRQMPVAALDGLAARVGLRLVAGGSSRPGG